MNVNELETPVMVVDLEKVEHNLTKMQSYCDLHGLALRPHIKTHKIPRLAKRQLELGAKGITCQKLSEALVMAESGIEDIFISYPLIGEAKVRRLEKLAQIAHVKVAADSEEAVLTAARAGKSSGTSIGVLVDFDSGAGRTGVTSVKESLKLARLAADGPNTTFEGFMTYPTSASTSEFLIAARELFSGEGLEIKTVSGGGTPNAWIAHTVQGLTEVRVGTYIYHDRTQVAVGAASLEECAVHVHATVVSMPTPDRAILDSGSKTLSSDLIRLGRGYEGHGLVREYPEATIIRLYEEHALVDLSGCSSRPVIGERVRILPNHVCVVTNLHDRIAVADGDGSVEFWAVEARGKTL